MKKNFCTHRVYIQMGGKEILIIITKTATTTIIIIIAMENIEQVQRNYSWVLEEITILYIVVRRSVIEVIFVQGLEVHVNFNLQNSSYLTLLFHCTSHFLTHTHKLFIMTISPTTTKCFIKYTSLPCSLTPSSRNNTQHIVVAQ